MPPRAKRPCKQIGCPNLTSDISGRCDSHRKGPRDYDRNRGTASERGYGYRWQKYRLSFLRKNPLCVECLKEDKVVPSRHVDHIIAVNGPGDPLFWDSTNHQALCHSCHSRKSIVVDKRGFGKN